MFRFNKPEFGTNRLREELNDELFIIKKYLKTSLDLLTSDYNEKVAAREEEYRKALEDKKVEFERLVEEGEDPEVANAIASQIAGVDYFFDPEWTEPLEHFVEVSKNILLKSTLLLVYGVLENSLNQLCEFVRKYDGKRIKVNDLDEKDYLKRVKKYLGLVFDISANEKTWKKYFPRITTYQRVRNKIVHANAFFSKSDDFLQKLAKSNSYIKATSENELVITHEQFVTDFMDSCIPFFDAFIPSVEEKLGHPTLVLELLWHLTHLMYVSNTSNAKLEIDGGNFEMKFDFTLKESTRPLTFKMMLTDDKFTITAPKDYESFSDEEIENLKDYFKDLKREEGEVIKILKSNTKLAIDESTHLSITISQK